MKKLNLYFAIISILMGLLISCKPSQTSKEEANKTVVNQFAKILNTGNLDRMDELFTPDIIRHSQAGGDIKGLEEYKKYQQQLLATFPDEHNTINLIIAEGDYVAGYNTLTATQKGLMGPFQATGKEMKSEYVWIFRMEEGKIAEIWVEWDNVAVLTQLGHLSPPEKSE